MGEYRRRWVTTMEDAPEEIWLEISVHSQTEPEIEDEHWTAPDKVAVLYRPVAIHQPLTQKEAD